MKFEKNKVKRLANKIKVILGTIKVIELICDLIGLAFKLSKGRSSRCFEIT